MKYDIVSMILNDSEDTYFCFIPKSKIFKNISGWIYSISLENIAVAWKDQEVITYKESELKRFNVACGQFEDQKLGEGLPNSTFFCCLTSKDLLLMVPDYRWYSLFSNTSFQKIWSIFRGRGSSRKSSNRHS